MPKTRNSAGSACGLSSLLMRFVHSSIALPYLLQRSEGARKVMPSLGVSSLDLGPHGKPLRLFFRPESVGGSRPECASRGLRQLRERQISRISRCRIRRSPAPRNLWEPALIPNFRLNRPKLRRKCHVPMLCACRRNAFPSSSCPVAFRVLPRGCPHKGVSSLDLGRRLLPRGPSFIRGPSFPSNFSGFSGRPSFPTATLSRCTLSGRMPS